MKKIFTLLSAILMALTSYAQLEITDEAGNVVADGATVEFNAEVLDLGGGFVIIDCAPAAPYITNKGDSYRSPPSSGSARETKYILPKNVVK